MEAFGRKFPQIHSKELALTLKGEWQAWGNGAASIGLFVQRMEFKQDDLVSGVPVIAKPGTTVAGWWTLPFPQKLQTTGVELNYQRQIDECWTGMLQVIPSWRVAGAATLADKGFGGTVTVLGICAVRPGLQVALGASGDSLAEGDNCLVPVVGVDWRISPHWRLAFGLPRTGLYFTPTENLEMGVVGEGAWTTYYVQDPGAPDRQTYSLGQPLTNLKMESAEARVGLQINWQANQSIGFSLTCGAVGLRRIKYPDRNLTVKADNFDGGYLSIGLNLKF